MTTTIERQQAAVQELLDTYTDGQVGRGPRAIAAIAARDNVWTLTFEHAKERTANMAAPDAHGNRQQGLAAYFADEYTMTPEEFATRMHRKIEALDRDLVEEVIREYLMDNGTPAVDLVQA